MLALLAATVAPKVALAPSTAEESIAPTARLGRFLATHSKTPPQPLRRRPHVPIWAGWRFQAGGCEAMAFPNPRSGEFDPQNRELTGPGQRLAYVYRGQISDAPPGAHRTLDFVLYRILLPFGLADPQMASYVAVIHPAGCDGPLKLDWKAL